MCCILNIGNSIDACFSLWVTLLYSYQRYATRDAERKVQMKKILVTGGTGFLAGWVIRQLLQEGYTVRTTVRSANKFQKIVKMLATVDVDSSNLSYTVADLTSSNGWDEAMDGINDVLHLASPLGGNDQDNPKLIDIAKEGVTHVINAAVNAHVNKVVMTSSEAANYPQKITIISNLMKAFGLT